MIVVIGPVHLEGDGPDAGPGGLSAGIAAAAATGGAAVEAITKVGDDPAGDALLLGLAQRGIGHVAVLRDAAHPTPRRAPRPADEDPAGGADADGVATPVPDGGPVLDTADVGLALRYLTDYRVVVTVHATASILVESAAAADWAAAHLVVVARPGDTLPDALPSGAVVVEAPDTADGDSALASRLGTYAAAIDGGAEPRSAFAEFTAVVD